MSCDDGNDLANRTPNGYCLHPPCNSSFDCSGPPPHRNCLERPRCLHLLGTDHIRITNLTMRNSPFWNLHFQFSSDIIVDGVQIYQGSVSSLRRFKDDTAEVGNGFECGIGVGGYNDVKIGDVIEAFELEEEPATL